MADGNRDAWACEASAAFGETRSSNCILVATRDYPSVPDPVDAERCIHQPFTGESNAFSADGANIFRRADVTPRVEFLREEH
jgi:hypothetical protein